MVLDSTETVLLSMIWAFFMTGKAGTAETAKKPGLYVSLSEKVKKTKY